MGRGLRASTLVAYLILAGLCCFLSYHIAHFWYRAPLRPDNPPETFQEMDLVGVWKADYRRYEWERCEGPTDFQTRQAHSLEEWLVLRRDKTFYQVLRDRRGEIPDQGAQGTWGVERFPDGVTRLHLEGGRFFAGDVCHTYPHLSPVGGYYSSDQTGHELDFDPGKAILVVGWDRFAKDLYLEYPLVGSDLDAPIIVEFARVPESEASSVPTPAP